MCVATKSYQLNYKPYAYTFDRDSWTMLSILKYIERMLASISSSWQVIESKVLCRKSAGINQDSGDTLQLDSS